MKSRFIINILCIPFLVLVVLLGCSKGSETYFPLKEGMTWEYNSSFSSSFEKSKTTKFVTKNFAPRLLEGKEVTPQKTEVQGRNFFNFMVEDSKGIYQIAIHPPGAVEPIIFPSPGFLIKYPIQVGTTWEGNVSSSLLKDAVVPVKVTIEKVDDVVTVSAGTFKGCLKLKGVGTIEKDVTFPGFSRPDVAKIRYECYDWYAPGVGLIREIIKETREMIKNGSGYLAEGSLVITVQLESFKK